MNLKQKLYQNKFFIEYQNNKRLQWMLVLIVAILVLSLMKKFTDGMQQQRSETLSQITLLEKLSQTAQNNTPVTIIESISIAYKYWNNSIPTAISGSIAEAKALTEIEQKLGMMITRKRVNLIGSEQLSDSKQVFWQVRVEIAGQMAELDLIKLLQHFDNNAQHARIASFQYAPKVSNSLNLVVDLLYRRTENA